MVPALVTAIVVLLVVIVPFFKGAGGMLAAGSMVDSKDVLKATKQALLRRYLQDENAFKNKEISERQWRSRRAFLVHRYMDAARRLDFLNAGEN